MASCFHEADRQHIWVGHANGLDWPLEFYQCYAVHIHIYCCSMRQKFNKKDVFPATENCSYTNYSVIFRVIGICLHFWFLFIYKHSWNPSGIHYLVFNKNNTINYISRNLKKSLIHFIMILFSPWCLLILSDPQW